jgi:poly(A) polymerase
VTPTYWTTPMRQALAALQRRPTLRHILSYAEQRQVQIYVVGGPLRDVCLGRLPHDMDLVLAGDVMGFARGIANQMGAAYVPLDPERGEARLVYRRGESFDFAPLRGGSIVADLCHRDFTINALACPLAAILTQAEPEFIDPHGGFRDLQERLIRMVSPTSFQEDPLRLLRAFRFAATLEGSIEAATLASMQTAASRLGEIAVERIHHELFTLFSAPRSGPQVVTMAHLGLLEVLFPELTAIRDAPRAAAGQFDFFRHAIDTYEAVEGLLNDLPSEPPMLPQEILARLRGGERPALLKCAALLHALGDPPPCHPAIGVAAGPLGWVSPSPAEAAARQWEQIGRRLKLSRQRIGAITTLLAHRHRPFIMAGLEAEGRLTRGIVYAWSQEVGEAMLNIFALAMGDAKACGQIETPVYGVRSLGRCAVRVWELYQRHILPVLESPRLVTGDDLRRIFHLPPGPRFKTLLETLQAAQVEGHIRTRAEALAWVEQQLRRG